MSSGERRPYRLSPRALTDLDDVWRYSAETWSIGQADRYIDELVEILGAIAATPLLARERTEFTPPVRIHAHQRQLIVYTVAEDHVVILRILGGGQDWLSILHATEA